MITFDLSGSVALLERTPRVLGSLLTDLPPAWTSATEGPATWSPFDVVGHLIHAERTNWMPRIEHILRHNDTVPYPPFERDAMFAASAGLSIADLLRTFESLRVDSLRRLADLELTETDLDRRGRHPEFGLVTLRQQLATWVVHDLDHISQIVRVLAKQYGDAVGPWQAYLSVLRAKGSVHTS